MSNLIISHFKLDDPKIVNYLKVQSERASKETKVIYHPAEKAVEIYFKNKPFDTVQFSHVTLHDTVLLDPKMHGKLSNHELKFFGTTFQIKNINGTVRNGNSSDFGMSPDYIMWQSFLDNPIHVQFEVNHSELNDIFSYPGNSHNAVLEYLKADTNIEILDDGIMDAAELAFLRNQFMQIKNASVDLKVLQFGYISVWLKMDLPNTVGDIVRNVKAYKKQIFKSIRNK